MDVMPVLTGLMVQHESRTAMLRNVTWVISNLCRGKPSPPLEKVQPALPYLARLLHCNDTETVRDALWTFSYLCDGSQEQVQAVIEAGVTGKIVELLGVKSD